MSAHVGYVVKITNLKSHPNADRLQLAEFFGETAIVPLDIQLNDIGIYFPSDLQLSAEFCEVNHLCRKHQDGTPDTGYLDPDKRNIKPLKLREVKSYGIYLPLTALEPFGDTASLSVGDTIDVFNGHMICQKYIPRTNHRSSNNANSGNRIRKHKEPVAPLFAEHADTEQLAYNHAAFKPNDEIEITLKIHGTSQRTGYLPVLKGYKKSLLDWLLARPGKPIYDWGYVSGTRRTVLENYEGGYYGSNAFREVHSKFFEGKLWKGETAYYEVAGFTDSGAPIMGDAPIKDKELKKEYGDVMRFSYGCEEGTSDFYVYRMTMTNEDGDVVEYTPDFMRYRCEQMGCKCVPVFTHFILHDYDLEMDERTAGEIIQDIAEKYYDGADPIGKTHIREGVVVRIINRPKFAAYKHKNWGFKYVEGLIKDSANAPDMEEAQEVASNETE